MTELYYLASPYSSDIPGRREFNYEEQSRLAALLIHNGYNLITPIEMCHHLSKRFSMPTGYEFWKTRDRLLVSRCDGVIVCMMEGWEESVGVTDEVAYATELGKKVLYLDPASGILTLDPVNFKGPL